MDPDGGGELGFDQFVKILIQIQEGGSAADEQWMGSVENGTKVEVKRFVVGGNNGEAALEPAAAVEYETEWQARVGGRPAACGGACHHWKGCGGGL